MWSTFREDVVISELISSHSCFKIYFMKCDFILYYYTSRPFSYPLFIANIVTNNAWLVWRNPLTTRYRQTQWRDAVLSQVLPKRGCDTFPPSNLLLFSFLFVSKYLRYYYIVCVCIYKTLSSYVDVLTYNRKENAPIIW